MAIKKKNHSSLGEFNRKITFKGQIINKTATLGYEESLVDITELTNVWAKVRDNDGTRITVQDQHYDNVIEKIFTIRFDSKFRDYFPTPNYYIWYNNRIYKVRNIVNIGEADRYLEFKTEAMDVNVDKTRNP